MSGRTAKVADASVLAAMYFQESQAWEAKALLTGANLYEPRILAFELTSVARKKSLEFPQHREEIARSLEIVLALNMHWVEVNHSAVLALALQMGLSTYDASYLYLARTLGIPLVTFDKRLNAAIADDSTGR